MGLLILTATAETPSTKGVKAYTATQTPKVKYLEPSEVVDISPKKNSSGTVIGSVISYGASKRIRRKYTVAERPQEVEVARDPVTTNPYANSMNLAVTASGSVIGDSPTAITTYLNKVTAATITDDMSVQLPTASGARKAVVIMNAASTAISVFPTASESIAAGASNVGVSLAVGARAHFYAYSATNWRYAVESL